jgi:NADPH-dependent F420 reductase
MTPLAFLGGTGPEGLGLALRFARAGEPIVIGSRMADRAEAAAAKIRSAVPTARVEGRENLTALEMTDRVVLAFPFEGLPPFLDAAGGRLAGKLVIDVIVPLAFKPGFCEVAPVPGAASVGELIQSRVPEARVVSAFKNLPAEILGDLSVEMEGDVVLCGNDAGARTQVGALAGRIPGLRAVDAGKIANARYLEAITALLVNLNRKHKAHTSIAVLGLPG